MISCPTCGTSYPPTVRLCPRDGTVLEGHKRTEERFVGTVLQGKYRLDSYLSRGGMGSVFRATHVMLGKPVAVKLINADLVGSADVVRRFQREARAATSLNHPNIVSVYDLGQTDDGTLYIAMELVEGKTLKDEIRENGPIEPRRIVYILGQVARALGLAHRHNIIHRDLKPQNVMLTHDSDGREIAKVLDFGIAKTFDEVNTQLTATGFALGTPQYMSPEQTMGTQIDGRSDIYALGVILYEMLIGEVPFNDPSTPAILVKHMTEVPAPPSQRRPDVVVPPHLEAVALKCLEKDPAKRYQTMDEFAAALEPTAGVAATVLSVPAAAPAATSAGAGTLPTATAAAPLIEGATKGTPAAPVSSAAPGVPETQPTLRSPGGSPGTPRGRNSRTVLGFVATLVLLSAVAGAWLFVGRADKPGALQSQPQPAPDATPVSALPPAPDPPRSPAAPEPAGSKEAPAETRTSSSTPPPTPESTRRPEAAAPAVVTAPPPRANTSRDGSLTGTMPSTESPTRPAARGPVAPAGASARSTAPAGSRSPARAPGLASSASATESRASAPSVAEPHAPPAQTAFPPNPTVFAQCKGPAEICGAVRSAFDQALQSQNLAIARSAQRAHIVLLAEVTALGEERQESFGTEFSIRNYSIEVTGDARASDEVIPMPAARHFSFDPRYGSERVQENARAAAIEAVGRVREFLKTR